MREPIPALLLLGAVLLTLAGCGAPAAETSGPEPAATGGEASRSGRPPATMRRNFDPSSPRRTGRDAAANRCRP